MGSAGMACRPPDGLPAAACFRQESTLRGERNAPKKLRLRVASPFVLDANERPRQEGMLYDTV